MKRTEKSRRGFNAGEARQKQKEKRGKGRKSVYTGPRNAPRCDSKSRAVKKRTNGKKERKVKEKKKAERKTGIEKEKKGREGAEREREGERRRL